jgi:hypothetical protein
MDSIADSTKKVQDPFGTYSPIDTVVPIARNVTDPGNQEDQAQQASSGGAGDNDGGQINKYLFAEFAGFDGERYLDSICQMILPYAMWRTWHYSVDFQAPGNLCYVGPTKLATRVKPQERKIMLDFQCLELHGLMHRYPARLPVRQEDGSIRYHAVTVKDFRPLYELAHEYHCWLRSSTYIPPERQYIDLMMENPELAAWLCRFDNYRRLLLCRKPGRKPTHQTGQPLTAAQVLELHQLTKQEQTQPTSTSADVLNMNQYFNPTDKTDSANRISSTDQLLQNREDSNLSTSKEEKEGVTPLTIRRSETESGGNEKDHEEHRRETETRSNSNEEETSSTAPERVKEVDTSKTIMTCQEKAAAVLAHVVPPEHWQELYGGKKPQAPQRVRRPIPDHLEANIKSLSADMGDRPEFWKSNVTRAAKLYFTAKQVYGPKQFTARLFYGKVSEAKSAAQARTNIEHFNEEADTFNRMPFFWTCFENLLGFTDAEFAYARSKEPLYLDSDIKEFVRWYHQEQRQ